MPRISRTLPDVEESVSRPIIYQVAADILQVMSLKEDPVVIYGGKRNNISLKGSTISDQDDREARFNQTDMLFIEVKEGYSKEDINYVHGDTFVERALFNDRKLGISLRPVYLKSNVTMNITYRSQSETEIRRCYSHLYETASRGRTTNLHIITYSYPLSAEFIVLLDHLYSLREKVEPYGEDFFSYFKKHSNESLSCIMAQNASNRSLVITERQKRIEGEFDFVGTPDEPTYDRDRGNWEISFSYTFSYQRIDKEIIEYPISVHNQIIDSRFLDYLESVYDPELYRSSANHDLGSLERFGVGYKVEARPLRTYTQIPLVDDFSIPDGGPFNTMTVFLTLVNVEDDKRTLLDLKELGDYAIDPDILAFMKKERLHLTKLYHSMINVSVYIGDELQPDGVIEVTDDLIVKAVADLDIRKQYRIRIAVCAMIEGVLYNALIRLSKEPTAFVKVISVMNELIAIDPDFKLLGLQPEIAEWQFTAVWRALKGTEQGMFGGPSRDLDGYQTTTQFGGANHIEYITKLPREVIQRYFAHKRMVRFTTMNASVFVRARK